MVRKITALIPIKDLEQALEISIKKINKTGISLKDLKTKSKILKQNLNSIATKNDIELRLRK